MREAVTDVLIGRLHEPPGLGRTALVSIALHAAALGVIAVAPHARRAPAIPPEARPMFISLGGAPGPRTGGMTAIGGRPIQAVDTEARRTPPAPPAPRPPEMALPEP
ncbi:MAG TPA: hypothetical protein VNI83_01480, partial [Vicinamibacterales bacterium]|nr:hypothetical protein [Vicinamibacterales bacterium]